MRGSFFKKHSYKCLRAIIFLTSVSLLSYIVIHLLPETAIAQVIALFSTVAGAAWKADGTVCENEQRYNNCVSRAVYLVSKLENDYTGTIHDIENQV